MDLSTVLSVFMDIALGGMALKLTLSLEKTVKMLALGHEELTRRVEKLEKNDTE